ncbi:ATP-binding cassette domain-containing protein [Nocardia brasiliensis]
MPALTVAGLRHSYKGIVALDGLDLEVAEGTITGLLGPNGAGKTTAVRILATLLRADSGRARVCGVDVNADPQRVRAMIGLTGQYAAVDELLTGTENLVLIGRLHRCSAATARRRAAALLEQFDLTEAADRRVETYSGGMRRRLDLAASLVTQPSVLFLDEPTTGLDPRSRRTLWLAIEALPAQGTTVLLTTQYLEEADRLADAITIIDRGRVIAEGSPEHIKAQAGGARAEVLLGDPGDAAEAAAVLGNYGSPTIEDDLLTVPMRDSAATVAEILRELDAVGVRVTDLRIRHPSLDDAFLALTGHHLATEAPR